MSTPAPGSRDGSRFEWDPWALLLGGVVLAFGWSLCRRGIVLSDEGYLLAQALDMTQGKVLYRDMDAFVAPGVWFLLAGLFQIVEPSVLASRVPALLGFGATVGVSCLIVRRLAGRGAAFATVAGYAVFAVWAFPAWTFSFYSPYAVCFALAALERLTAWREDPRPARLVAVGALLGLSIAFKQNYGALASLGAGLALAAILVESRPGLAGILRRAPGLGWRLAVGLALVALPCVAYFAWHGAADDAFRALVLHPFDSFLGQHDIPYLSPSEMFEKRAMIGTGRLTYAAWSFSNSPIRFGWSGEALRAVEILHVLLYWIPPCVFAGLAYGVGVPWARGGRLDGGLAALLAVTGCVYLGVFPRADFNHLMNVYQVVIVAGAVALHRLALRPTGEWRRRGRFALAVFALGFTAYAGMAGFWWLDLVRVLDSEIPQRRGGVLVSQPQMQMIDFEVRVIQQRTQPGEAVLTLPGFAMLNFVSERPMPSRYYNLYAVHIAHDEGAGVVAGSEANRVELVIADSHDFFSAKVGLREYAPRLVSYLHRHFRPLFAVAIDQHLFLERREPPLPERSTLDPLADCDTGTIGVSRRVIRGHLLFESLYHLLSTSDPAANRQAATLCRVRVPVVGGALTFALGYRQPTSVSADVSVQTEIWVHRLAEPTAGARLVHREALELIPAGGWGSPVPQDRRVDLSDFAGEEVLLNFRSLYEGRVRMNPFDELGFAVIWQDPQIELAGGDR